MRPPGQVIMDGLVSARVAHNINHHMAKLSLGKINPQQY